jgi:N-acetylglucosaminyldiphosphoundecaprenol N-acetyl-beta-D-mannosaminyltransferase
MAILSSIDILGVRVDDVTMNEACDLAAGLIAAGGVHQFTTVNPEFIMLAHRDPEFAQVLERSALNVPDGTGVLWAARRQKHPLRERVAGVDLVQQLCARGSAYQWRVFFLGARPGVAELAAACLAHKYPGLTVAGTYAGSPAREEEQQIVERIRRAEPDLLFVAYGAPAQDKWLARNLPLLWPTNQTIDPNIGLVGMGVGGSLDFIAGAQKRAPEWMQRVGLEWFYRLLREPTRWRRQLALLRFAVAVMLQSKSAEKG